MRFRILGPVRVEVDGHEVAITASRDRVLLGVLLLHANQPLTSDQLIDAVWPERPPQGARNQLQGCVSRLRKRLGEAGLGRVIVTEPDGYRAVVDPGDVDLLEFRRLVRDARADAAEGRYEQAAASFRAGLALWRGSALAGIDGHAIPRAAAGLDEERVQALEERLAAELAAGAGGELVAELTELVASHPLRERLHRALMLALYRAGRQADALAAYRQARQLLHDELGIEPGTDLQELHQAILHRDPALDAGRPAATEAQLTTPTPRQLPSDVAAFSGRAAPLKALDELLARRPAATGPVVISAIAGTAGVGKTALAVHWAHLVADRFPDGQLHINLRGFDPTGAPVEPASAVRGFLDALAVPPQRIPAELDAQVSLYRSLLADRQMLIVLDNARDPDQVRPLLPGSSGCLVLVTSRNQLAGLAATDAAIPLPLDLLPDQEARQMLAARLGADRIAAEPESVADLLAACAGLPLALAIAAARAAARPDFPLAAIAEEVRQAGAGLEPWTGADPASDLRAVFSWSYRALDSEVARLFRLLGLHPGPDFAAPAAASLAAIQLPEARRLLTILVEANLLIEHTPGRYSLHDLLRTYATELAHTTDTEEDRHAGLHRLLDHYLYTADGAAVLLDPHIKNPRALTALQPGVVLVDLHTDEQAMAWLSAEQFVLFEAIEQAGVSAFPTHTWKLASCLSHFLSRRGNLQQILAIQRIALVAAQQVGDPRAEAGSYLAIGNAHAALHDHNQAREDLVRALRLYLVLGDEYDQARVHFNLSWLEVQAGDYDEALRNSWRAYELFQSLGSLASQARALNLVAWSYSMLGDYNQAVRTCELALTNHHAVGDTVDEGFTRDSLGYAHYHLGNHQRAIDCYKQALALFERHEHLRGRAESLHHLGDAHDALGEVEAAGVAWQAALTIYEQLQQPADELRAKLGRLADGA